MSEMKLPFEGATLGRTNPLVLAMLVLAGLAFLDSLFNLFWTGNGIHGSEGAILVVISTLLLSIGAAVIAFPSIPGWLRGVFEVLIGLDFLGTALAAYLLEAWILLALIILAAIAWVAHLAWPGVSVSTAG